jgi:hypothetical protein
VVDSALSKNSNCFARIGIRKTFNSQVYHFWLLLLKYEFLLLHDAPQTIPEARRNATRPGEGEKK